MFSTSHSIEDLRVQYQNKLWEIIKKYNNAFKPNFWPSFKNGFHDSTKVLTNPLQKYYTLSLSSPVRSDHNFFVNRHMENVKELVKPNFTELDYDVDMLSLAISRTPEYFFEIIPLVRSYYSQYSKLSGIKNILDDNNLFVMQHVVLNKFYHVEDIDKISIISNVDEHGGDSIHMNGRIGDKRVVNNYYSVKSVPGVNYFTSRKMVTNSRIKRYVYKPIVNSAKDFKEIIDFEIKEKEDSIKNNMGDSLPSNILLSKVVKDLSVHFFVEHERKFLTPVFFDG